MIFHYLHTIPFILALDNNNDVVGAAADDDDSLVLFKYFSFDMTNFRVSHSIVHWPVRSTSNLLNVFQMIFYIKFNCIITISFLVCFAG